MCVCVCVLNVQPHSIEHILQVTLSLNYYTSIMSILLKLEFYGNLVNIYHFLGSISIISNVCVCVLYFLVQN